MRRYEKRTRSVVWIVLFFCIVAVCPCIGSAEETLQQQLNQKIWEELAQIDVSALEELFHDLSGQNLFGSQSFLQTMQTVLDGSFADNTQSFWQAAARLLFRTFEQTVPILCTVIAVGILCGTVGNRKNGLLSGTNDVVFFVCYALAILTVLAGVMQLVEQVRQTVFTVKTLLNLVSPPLLTLIAALGGVGSVKVYQPSVAFLAGGVVEVVANAVLPLFLFTTVFTVVSNLSKDVKLQKLTEFCKSAGNLALGGTFMIFTAFLTVQGLTAATTDSVSIRAAKFAAKNYVPLLGGYLSDGFDLILASSTLIKNAFGVGALCLLATAVLAPVLNVLAYSFGLKLASAMLEPLTDERYTRFLNETSKNLNLLVAAVIAVAFMVFLTVMLLIFTSNAC